MEKEPLQLQPINQLFIAAVPRPENLVQHTGEIVLEAKERPENLAQKTGELLIEAKDRPENVFEQRDAIEILGMEKDPLQLQPINQLFIAAVPKPENFVQ